MLRFPHCLDNRLTDGGEVFSLNIFIKSLRTRREIWTQNLSRHTKYLFAGLVTLKLRIRMYVCMYLYMNMRIPRARTIGWIVAKKNSPFNTGTLHTKTDVFKNKTAIYYYIPIIRADCLWNMNRRKACLYDDNGTDTLGPNVKVKVKVEVILLPTIGWPVRPGVRLQSGTSDQFFPFSLIIIFSDSFGYVDVGAPSLTRCRVCTFQFFLGISSASFLRSESHATHKHILLSLPAWRAKFLYLILPQEQGCTILSSDNGLGPNAYISQLVCTP
jgi:hypothetical protein